MKGRIFLLAICLVLCGCGTFRKVFKLRESSQIRLQTEYKADSVRVKIDKTITRTVETIDTVVTVPGKTVSAKVPFNPDSLMKGIVAIKDKLVDVKLTLDPSGQLSVQADIKDQQIPVRGKREKITNNDIIQSEKSTQSARSELDQTSSKKQVEKEPAKIGIWLIAMIVGIALLLGAGLIWWRMAKPKI